MRTQKRVRAADMRFLEDLFEMGDGYVLDFTNATFAEFFEDELGINIYDPRFEVDGTSKAKRLRCFLRNADVPDVLRALNTLWEYRESIRRRAGAEETIPNAEAEFYLAIERLGGKPPTVRQNPVGLDQSISSELRDNLMEVSELKPQERGYAFERFLKQFFDANGLAGRESFRNRGEQIDGSFVLDGETYLLEAKWTSVKVDAATLRAFNAKVEEKAAWSRGLLISNSGFSDDGLYAFGTGKRVICMDGLDLYEILHNGLAFADVMSRKVRRAAETGLPFVRVRDLY